MSIQQTVFGPGVIFAKSSAAGAAYKQLGSIQEFSFDETKNMKELYGSYQNAIDVATSTIKQTGKMKQAVINAQAYNDIFWNQTLTKGSQTLTAVGEAGSIPATTTYTITVSHSATFTVDLGVIYADGSAIFTQVQSAPTVGQYSVASGIYTFAAADAGKAVSISYRYTGTSGNTVTDGTKLIGDTTVFSLLYVTQHSGKELSIEFYKVISNKIAMSFKQEDFMIPELDLAMFANDAGNVKTVNTAS